MCHERKLVHEEVPIYVLCVSPTNSEHSTTFGERSCQAVFIERSHMNVRGTFGGRSIWSILIPVIMFDECSEQNMSRTFVSELSTNVRVRTFDHMIKHETMLREILESSRKSFQYNSVIIRIKSLRHNFKMPQFDDGRQLTLVEIIERILSLTLQLCRILEDV